MGFFRRFTRPDHSLILIEDPYEPVLFDEFKEKLDEVRKYYEFLPDGEFLQKVTKKEIYGYAMVALRAARVGTFQLTIPYLEEEKIPYTLFTDVEIIGTNRLPEADEASLRQDGVLPLDELKPSRFLVTWGKIEKLNPEFLSVGVHSEAESEGALEQQYTYLRTQFKNRISPMLLSSRLKLDSEKLRRFGVFGVIGKREGIVKNPVNPLQMPVWNVTNS